MRHPIADKFLRGELEQSEANLNWLNAERHPGLVEEYQRRHQIVRDLLSGRPKRPETIIADINKRLIDIDQQLQHLANTPVSHPMHQMLLIDQDYLVGLRDRLQHTLRENTFTYALENVKQL